MNNGSAKTLRGSSRQPGEPDRTYTRDRRGAIRLVPNCDRYRYKQRKRAYKNGEIAL